MKTAPFFAFLVLIFFSSCNNMQSQNDPIPPHQTFKIESKSVNETRVINVWLPDAYASSQDSLPVLYMPDGGIKEDFPHIANTLADLIANKKIKPLILVGIENTQRRLDLTGPTSVAKDREIAPEVSGSANFRNFIKDELFAEINKRYRTTTEKGIIGESLAGLFVTETFLLHPEMFDYYIAFDPSMWWNDKYLLKNTAAYLTKFPETPKRFWFAGSGAKDISGTVGKFAKALKASIGATVKWHYSPEAKEKHNTIFRATKEKALIWTLGEE